MICRPSYGVFRWGQVLQRGDLPLFITDDTGNPASPFKVQYGLFYYPAKAHCPQQVGPCDRTPVMADVGEYYASAVISCGQPGDWFIEWRYQEVFEGPWVACRQGFKVFNPSAYCGNLGVIPPRGCRCSGPCFCAGGGYYPSCQWCCRKGPCGCSHPPRGW